MTGPLRHVFVGFACNNQCIFCAQGQRRAEPVEPAVDRQMADIERGDVVFFQGGEPLLHDAITEWVQRAVRRGASRVVVQTNGTRLAEADLAQRLADAGTTSLDVSLHGATPSAHDYHTGTAGSFARTLAGLDAARQAGLLLATTTVVTRSNYRHLPEIVDLGHRRGARAVLLRVARPLGRVRLQASLVPAEPMVRPFVHRAIGLARRRGMEFVCGASASGPGATSWFAGLGVVEATR